MDEVQKKLRKVSNAGPRGDAFARSLGDALTWGATESSKLQSIRVPLSLAPYKFHLGAIGDDPAVLFVGHRRSDHSSVASDVALFAYHSSIDWCCLSNGREISLLNSRWQQRNDWFRLPSVGRSALANDQILARLTPHGILSGDLEERCFQVSPPDGYFSSVDDALFQALDHWRSKAFGAAQDTSDLDSKLQHFFVQLFVLRAVEDRGLAPDVPSAASSIGADGSVDRAALEAVFKRARHKIQRELFAAPPPDVPERIIGGIVEDLYTPRNLPSGATRYNFDWIDPDILGRAYEKYVSTVLVAGPRPDAYQGSFFEDEPVREVHRQSKRKSLGIYYTPAYLSKFLAEQAVERWFAERDHALAIPHVIDFACGSGSFLSAAFTALVRRLSTIAPGKHWAREIVRSKCLVGVDVDEKAVNIARLALWLKLAEQPAPLPLEPLKECILAADSLVTNTWKKLPASFDIVLGNPPFLATGEVSSRDVLAKKFGTAQGRFDYSSLFVELAIEKLVDGGYLSMVVPNRIARNQDARPLRELLSQRCDVVLFVDFHDTEVFEGTSAYVALLVARRRAPDSTPAARMDVMNVYALPQRFVSAQLTRTLLDRTRSNSAIAAFDAATPRTADPWILLSRQDVRRRARLESAGDPLEMCAQAFQGIKTGANEVFVLYPIQEAEATVQVSNKFGRTAHVERSILRPVAFGADLRRYDRVQPSLYLIYPYDNGVPIEEDILEQKYPRAYRYLREYEDVLKARYDVVPPQGTRRWYELSRHREEGWLAAPGKLVMKDLATRPSFALDELGTFLIGGTAIVPADPQVTRVLLGYMNSSTVAWYLEGTLPAFRGRFKKVEPQHLTRIPIPKVLLQAGEQSYEMLQLVNAALAATRDGDGERLRDVEERIDALADKIASVPDDEAGD